MSNPIIPRTNSAPGAGAPASLLLGEIATNRSTGKVYLGADSGVVEIQGAGGATSFSELTGSLGTQQLCALSGDVVAVAGTASTQIAALQGNPVSAASPSNGQVLQWNGTNWVSGTMQGGGSGGGGVLLYFNQNTTPDSPITGLPAGTKELGRIGEVTATSITSAALSQVTYDVVAGFVTDLQDPNTTSIPAGIWDINVWANGNANNANQTILQFKLYKYNGTTATLIATSADLSMYDPTVIAEYTPSLVVPQTTLDVNDRIYIQILAKGTTNNRTVTLHFGGIYPSHTHTTLPSIIGSGLVKVVNGVFQNPASLLLNADVDANAAISQSKISGLVSALAGKISTSDIIAISNGGTGATSAVGALAAIGAQAALTTNSPLGITQGGTGEISSEAARVAMGGMLWVDWAQTSVVNGTYNTGAGTLTYSANGALSFDTVTPSVGDTVFLSGQGTTTTPNGIGNGPWAVTQVGSPTTPAILTRPSWFTGTKLNTPYFVIRNGPNNAGIVRGIVGPATSSKSGFTVGTSVLTSVTVSARSSAVFTGGSLMSGRQTFAANTTTVNPISFQTSTTFLSALTSNAMEWVTDRLYITASNAASRFQVAYTSDIPALTTAAPAALATAASAGISTQAARADHVHALPLPAINSTALTAYTLALSDNNATIQTTASSAVAITIPLNSSIPLPVGAQVLVYQSGTGQITFAGASGVTLRSSGSKTKTAAQYALATLLKVATNEWVLGGDITT